MTNIGVVFCTCRQEIEASIDIAQVARSCRDLAATTALVQVCSSSGRKQLESFVDENGIEALVVGACPARFLSRALTNTCDRAGIPPHQFALVDWREGCAWPHAGNREEATAKAIDMVRMGIARVEGPRPLRPRGQPVVARVLVVGGGIAGMTAAVELADRNIQVTLIERSAHLGGHAPTDGDDRRLGELVQYVSRHSKIELQMNARLRAARRVGGSYRVTFVRALANGSWDEREITAGAVILATGAAEMRPIARHRHDGRRVVTVGEFQVQVESGEPIPSRVVYLLCAGSRDANVPYCSKVCCGSAICQALRIKRANPETEIAVLFRDLYLPDVMAEENVQLAHRAGVTFLPYDPSRPPRVEEEYIRMVDPATRRPLAIEYDRLVLATPLVPDPEAGRLAHLFGIARDLYGFFSDPHWRGEPDRVPERSIFVCGGAHAPTNLDGAVGEGMAAAARAARFIRKGVLAMPLWGAAIDRELCTGCAQCTRACSFGAIQFTAESFAGEVRAQIDPFRCLACGNCLAACPSKAITMPQSGDRQVLAQIDAALGTYENSAPPTDANSHPRSLIFACHWSGFAAMELAGARRAQYPASVRVLELPCSARLDSLHVLYAFFRGAERVTLALCPPGECHLGNGNVNAEERIRVLRTQLATWGIDPGRLQSARLMGDDAAGWVKIVTAAAEPTFHSSPASHDARRLA